MAGKSNVARKAQAQPTDLAVLSAELRRPELHRVSIALHESASMLALLDDLASEDLEIGRHGVVPTILKLDADDVRDAIESVAHQRAAEAIRQAMDSFAELCATVQPLVEAAATMPKPEVA